MRPNKSKPTIGILGASGFVGSALVERLYFDQRCRDRFDVVAFIHSYGNAARIARLPVSIDVLNLLDGTGVERAIARCDFVVNATRGDSLLMIDGLKNLIAALARAPGKRLVHLSSVAIYGEDPSPESAHEDAPENPNRTAYGDLKSKQDALVFDLHRRGVPAIILCPSNIGGPYSSLIVDLVRKLQSGEIVLVDDGREATNIVHVDNLVQAILTALQSETGWGERYFVNETQPITWKQFYGDVAAMLGIEYEFPTVSREDTLASGGRDHDGGPSGLRRHLGTVVSRDFREAMSTLPVLKQIDKAAMGVFRRLDPRRQEELRQKLRKPVIIREAQANPSLAHKLITAQSRRVYHSPNKLITRLGYEPLLDYRQGLETTRKWLEFANPTLAITPLTSR